jgi:hypothetical protein
MTAQGNALGILGTKNRRQPCKGATDANQIPRIVAPLQGWQTAD